jgi:hypothetical protein
MINLKSRFEMINENILGKGSRITKDARTKDEYDMTY